MRKKITRSEASDIKKRLLDCMPASRFEMDTLCRLADIRASRDLPTAAVECTRRPRLLINPDFVAKHCERDEHLFLLVMHELHHVLLAHTRMYPKMTQAHNVAFDAIINAGLMREFSTPEYMGFFDEMYKPDVFPECLLRPPVGWPHNPQYPDEEIGPSGMLDIIKRLYPVWRFRPPQPPLYEEVLNLLLKAGMFDMPMLLGNHGEDMVNDPFMKQAMRQISGKWPEIKMEGRGNGGRMRRGRYELAPIGEECRRAFSNTLKLALSPREGRMHRKARMSIKSEGGTGVLINPYDRTAPARRRLRGQNTLYNQPTTTRARLPEKPSTAYIYLDVSGSMNFVISYLLDLLVPYVAKRQAEIFQFSTTVSPLPFDELRSGKLKTTGGTSINCVIKHMVEAEVPVEKAIVLTDGEVGAPIPELAQQLMECGIKMHVVLANGCTLHHACHTISQSIITLPPVQ